jgi:hypothetical protein
MYNQGTIQGLTWLFRMYIQLEHASVAVRLSTNERSTESSEYEVASSLTLARSPENLRPSVLRR